MYYLLLVVLLVVLVGLLLSVLLSEREYEASARERLREADRGLADAQASVCERERERLREAEELRCELLRCERLGECRVLRLNRSRRERLWCAVLKRERLQGDDGQPRLLMDYLPLLSAEEWGDY